MELLSPYGLDVLDELRSRIGVRSVAALARRVRHTLATRYGLHSPVVERIHVAGAFALTISTAERRYLFKLDEHDDPAALTAMLERIERLRGQGLPLLLVHSTQSGALFVAPFRNPHATGYLSDFITGAPATTWTSDHGAATATFFARFHALGCDEPPQPGEQMTFASRWPDLEDAVARLTLAGVLPDPALRLAHGLLAAGPPDEGLLWSHIHGDARLCHVLFADDRLVGVVDHDAGMWGERLLDLAFHLISHPDSARVAFLDLAAIQGWLAHYHALLPLSDTERAALPAALSCALLIELGETLWTIQSGRTGLSIADLAPGVALLQDLAVIGLPHIW